MDIAAEQVTDFLLPLEYKINPSHLALKIPFGLGYRKLLSPTCFVGAYIYSESLRSPFRQLHGGTAMGGCSECSAINAE